MNLETNNELKWNKKEDIEGETSTYSGLKMVKIHFHVQEQNS